MFTPAPTLLHDLVPIGAERRPTAVALSGRGQSLTYEALAGAIAGFASALRSIGLERAGRVAIYAEQRPEAVIASFGACAAGGVMVPINPLLKPGQVAHILMDCEVGILVTSAERFDQLKPGLAVCSALKHVILLDASGPLVSPPSQSVYQWDDFPKSATLSGHRVIDADLAAIFYTSGSTGSPKGVMVSHRNLICGAQSVVSYLDNRPNDVILAALPLSFDAGFSQLTTAFCATARAVLFNYLFPRDLLGVMQDEGVTGLTGVPPLFSQLARVSWPSEAARALRYIASTGGKMPRDTLAALHAQAPAASIFLMYGLTEAFRSTFLPPSELERRPDSIGCAIPGAEVLVLRPDGSPCDANEPGELVHRGALVTLGYWNDPVRTAERFRPLPKDSFPAQDGRPFPEIAVYSGDTVRRDEDGYLYFVGRNDEMIKTSGYRISPTELEELVRATGLVSECAAFGIEDATLGQRIVVVAAAAEGKQTHTEELIKACRELMPRYMVPAVISWIDGSLPRNPNGKIDRATLHAGLKPLANSPTKA